MTQVFSMALFTTRRIFLGAFLSVIHACSAAGTWIHHGINYGNAPPIQKVGRWYAPRPPVHYAPHVTLFKKNDPYNT
jgi:hypothetical protein